MKKYCDKCKKIDEVSGVMFHFSLDVIDASNGLFPEPEKYSLGARSAFKKLMKNGIELCADCFIEFLNFPKL